MVKRERERERERGRERERERYVRKLALHQHYTHSLSQLSPFVFNFCRLFLYGYIANQSDSEEAKRMKKRTKSI